MRPMKHLSMLVVTLALAAAGCDTKLSSDLSGKACDDAGKCADGWKCHPRTKICVTNDTVVNRPPVPEASDVSLDATGPTTDVPLDASASTDPDGDALTFSWKEGDKVLASAATATVAFAKGTHALRLTVDDGLASATKDVSVEVKNVSPTAKAKAPATVTGHPNAHVTLDGSQSADIDGDTLTYRWLDGATELATTARAEVDLVPGVHPLTLEVSDGTATATAQTTVTVQEGAALTGSLAVPAAASVGQFLDVTLTVQNTGGATAADVAPSQLTFNGDAPAEVVSGPTPVKSDIAGGAQMGFAWQVRVTGAGTLRISAEASGVDANDATTTVKLSKVTSQDTTVRHGPALVAAIVTDASPIDIGRAFGVSMRVTNNGQATAKGVSPGVLGQAGSGAGTVADGPTPAAVDLAGGASAEFKWRYTASRGGTLTFSGSATGMDENSGTVVSSPATTAAELTIQAPVNVSTTTASTRTTVNVGQSLTVTVTVKNDRPGPITQLAPTLTSDCSACLTQLTGPTPPLLAALPPGGTQAFTWSYRGATRGTVRLVGGATFTDPGGGSYLASGSRTPDIAVQSPASLALSAITAPAHVSQGQADAPLAVTVENTGDATGAVESLALAFQRGASDASDDFTATLVEQLPQAVAGGSTLTLHYRLTVKASATTGSLSVSGSGQGSDGNTAATAALGGTDRAAAFDVQAPAKVKVVAVDSPLRKVSQGQRATVTVALRNDGQAAATLGATTLLLTMNGTNKATEYQVTPAADNATTLAGGAGVTLRFTLAVAATATAGSLSVDANQAATDANSAAAAGSNGSAARLSWSVQTPGKVAVRTVTPTPRSVSQGQTNVALSFDVANQGDADVTLTNAKPVILRGTADASAEFAATSSPGNATTLAGKATTTLRFTVNVNTTSAEGAVSVGGSVDATDVNSGATAASAATATPATWTVQRPARGVVSNFVLPATLAQGQSVTVSYKVENTGTAAARIDDMGVTFTAGTQSKDSDYSVAPDAANPPTVAGGSTATLTFKVTALSSATTGTPIHLTPRIALSDANSNRSVTVDNPASGDWTVSTSANLAITTIRSGSGTGAATQKVSQGQQAIAVSVHLENNGPSDAVIDSLVLSFRTSTGVDRTSSFTATGSAGNVTQVAGNGAADLRFTVDVSAGAATEVLTVGAILVAHQAGGGEAINPTGPESPASWTVQAPPVLRIASVSSSAVKVSQGQSAIPLTIVVANDGQATANVGQQAPSFMNGSTDVTSQYTLHATAGNPATVAGGQQSTFQFTVDVAATATTGSITLLGTAGGTDQNSGTAVTQADGPQTPSAWTVQTPAKLVLDAVVVGATKVSQGQTGVTVTVTARNSGQAALNLSAAALKLTQGATDRTGDYTVARADTVASIDGGASASLAFTLSVKGGAAPGAVTVDASGTAADANSGAAASATGAATTASITVQRPAALTGAVAVTPNIVQADDPSNRTITVTMTATNTGQADATNVLPAMLTVGGSGTATLASGPTPSSAQTIAGGAHVDFTWTYRATGPCAVNFAGGASGRDANTNAAVNAAAVTSSDVAIKKVPMANAGADFSVFLDDRVALDARSSQPADCDPASSLTYAWAPQSGNSYAVTLSSSTAATPTFDAKGAGTLRVDLTVTASNPTRSSTSTVTVTVKQFESVAMTGVTATGLSERALAFDRQGRLVAGSDDYLWINNGSWRKIGTLASAKVRTVLADASDKLWLGYGDTNKVERATVDWTAGTASIEQRLLHDADTDPTQVTSSAFAANGDVWFATDRDLFSLAGASPTGNLMRLNPAGTCGLGVACRTYYAVAFDSQANVYSANDVSLFSSATGFSTAPTPDNVSVTSGIDANDHVRTIAAGIDKELWLGANVPGSPSASNGLARMVDVTATAHAWAPANFTHFTTATNPALGGNDVRAIATDAKGDVWFATSAGISRYHRVRGTILSYAAGTNGLPSTFDARAIAVDDAGGRRTVGIATGAGVVQIKR